MPAPGGNPDPPARTKNPGNGLKNCRGPLQISLGRRPRPGEAEAQSHPLRIFRCSAGGFSHLKHLRASAALREKWNPSPVKVTQERIPHRLRTGCAGRKEDAQSAGSGAQPGKSPRRVPELARRSQGDCAGSRKWRAGRKETAQGGGSGAQVAKRLRKVPEVTRRSQGGCAGCRK